VVDIGCTIGVATIDADCRNGEFAISRADLACNMAKRAGRNRVRVYSPEDDASVAALSVDMGWSAQIKQALEDDGFLLCAQPIVRTSDLEIQSYEILLRMIDINGDQIMPAGFIPSAERFGLMENIDRWVIKNSIAALGKYQHAYPGLKFTINLSGQTLADISTCDLIQDCVEQAGIDFSSITFEVTETTAIADMAIAEVFLSRLQSLGCITALDDFGTGMSSFAYLKDLPIDVVKIDGRFVQRIAENPVDQAMVKAMGEIAHSLDKKVVAEFVETEASLSLLQKYNIDYAQGYLFGRPKPIESLFAYKITNVFNIKK
jgi:EAL domain-containing protein (putative c-di-GMP-specific phosphodiesterase class I)